MSELIDVTVGRLGRAHGIKGDIAVDVLTDEPGRRFHEGAELFIDGRRIEVSRVRWNRGRLVVGLVGYPDRTAVEALTGALLTARVPADESPSEPEEYFDRQLVGLLVLDHVGREVGRVEDVLHLPAQDVLQIATPSGEERLVPFVAALVPEVDLAAGVVRLADVGGLLEDIDE